MEKGLRHASTQSTQSASSGDITTVNVPNGTASWKGGCSRDATDGNGSSTGYYTR